MTRFATCFGIVLALAGCATEEEVSGDLDRSLVHVEKGALEIVQSDKLTVGVYDDGNLVMKFRAETLSEYEQDLEIEVNGMMLTMTTDSLMGVIEYDGFTVEDGSETQMTQEDLLAINILNKALEQVEEPTLTTDVLTRMTSWYTEFPSTKALKGSAKVSGARSYTSICSSMNSYIAATHDDWDYNRWDDRTTYYAYAAHIGDGPCSDGTYFWKDGQWKCYEPDHDPNVEYSYGGCFGKCGAGCGSGTAYTYDCLDHDSCVRFGHSLASFWCDDEFTSCVDDTLFAPNCL